MNTIEQAVEAWKKEDSENRAIIVIATQRIEKEDGKNDMSSCDLVIGNKGLLVDILYHRMSDKNKDKDEHNVLPSLLRRAMSRFDLDAMLFHLSKEASKIEKMAKKLGLWDDDNNSRDNDAETAGKEADNE